MKGLIKNWPEIGKDFRLGEILGIEDERVGEIETLVSDVMVKVTKECGYYEPSLAVPRCFEDIPNTVEEAILVFGVIINFEHLIRQSLSESVENKLLKKGRPN